jgi:hypothetical protein
VSGRVRVPSVCSVGKNRRVATVETPVGGGGGHPLQLSKGAGLLVSSPREDPKGPSVGGGGSGAGRRRRGQ